MFDDVLLDSARLLLDEAPCFTVLPAGHGKTELVAAAARVAQDRGQRLLVLTHTHAGVDAIRRRLRMFDVVKGVRVTTLDSWAKSLVRAFPVLAGYLVVDEVDWIAVRKAALALLTNAHVQSIVAASYQWVIVDEYQDCSHAQHELVMAINTLVAVVILGDPLQAIYGFTGDELVSWETDLYTIPQVQVPIFPWRWHDKNEQLGQFLTDVRSRLLSGKPIEFSGSPVMWKEDTPQNRIAICKSTLNSPGDLVALLRMPNEMPNLARKLGGTFGFMEELEGKILMGLARVVDGGGQGVATAAAVLKFVRDCFSNLPSGLTAKYRSMTAGTYPRFRPSSQLGPLLTNLQAVAQNPTSAPALEEALAAAEALGGKLIRREAWYEMRRATKRWREGSSSDLVGAVRAVRDHSRIVGRRHERRVVSRVVLVKGQQFENCIVIGADSLRPCELYVALTRPTHRLIVLSSSMTLSSE